MGAQQHFSVNDDMRIASTDSLGNIKHLRERMTRLVNSQSASKSISSSHFHHEAPISSGGYKNMTRNSQQQDIYSRTAKDSYLSETLKPEQHRKRPAVAQPAKWKEEQQMNASSSQAAPEKSRARPTAPHVPDAQFFLEEVEQSSMNNIGDFYSESSCEEAYFDEDKVGDEDEESIEDIDVVDEIEIESKSDIVAPVGQSSSTRGAASESTTKPVPAVNRQEQSRTSSPIVSVNSVPQADPAKLVREATAAVPTSTAASTSADSSSSAPDAAAAATADISSQLSRLQAWEQQLREREAEVLQYKNSLSKPLGAWMPVREAAELFAKDSSSTHHKPQQQNLADQLRNSPPEIHIHNHLTPPALTASIAPQQAQSQQSFEYSYDSRSALQQQLNQHEMENQQQQQQQQRRWDEHPYWQTAPNRSSHIQHKEVQPAPTFRPAPLPAGAYPPPLPTMVRNASGSSALSAFPSYATAGDNFVMPSLQERMLSARLTDTCPSLLSDPPVMPPATQAVLRSGEGDRLPSRLSNSYAVRRNKEVDVLTDSIDLSGLSLEVRSEMAHLE